ncbi:MAG: hypothetical protein LAT84_12535 [Balneolia bacterium]|nr:hypothetical protein [Balneolia bacterium]
MRLLNGTFIKSVLAALILFSFDLTVLFSQPVISDSDSITYPSDAISDITAIRSAKGMMRYLINGKPKWRTALQQSAIFFLRS